MASFVEVNTVYGEFFGTSPPARATVAVPLPDHIRIRMECVAFKETQTVKRHALHVQGLSYWAPANIGPYSQAIDVSFYRFSSSSRLKRIFSGGRTDIHVRPNRAYSCRLVFALPNQPRNGNFTIFSTRSEDYFRVEDRYGRRMAWVCTKQYYLDQGSSGFRPCTEDSFFGLGGWSFLVLSCLGAHI